LGQLRQKLLAARERRIRPLRDEKILTAWNGLMIAAFAQAAQVLGPEYLPPARRAALYLWNVLRSPEGRLYRTTSPGAAPKLKGYLEDYSCFIDALITLYETDFDPAWLGSALELADVMVADFWDDSEGGFFFVAHDHEPLVVRSKEPRDGATPSGNSMAVMALLRLGKLAGRRDLWEKAERTLQLFRAEMESVPMAFGQMLVALDFYLGPVSEIAIVGSSWDPETQAVLRHLQQRFWPNKVLAFRDTAADQNRQEQVVRLLPWLEGKTALEGRVTTYICRDFTCAAPLVGLEALQQAEAADYSPQASRSTSSET
jgi:uncharacterized protein YyaL (SSP411 family)